MKKAIREYAERLIREYGDAAYQKAQEAARNAHRRRNGRLEHFLEKVASEIARRARVELDQSSGGYAVTEGQARAPVPPLTCPDEERLVP